MAFHGGQQPLLEVKNLKQYYPIKGGLLGRTVKEVKAVDGISFSVYPGETLGVVGESGCGKSVTWLAALGLLPGKATVSGSVRVDGKEHVISWEEIGEVE